jgi:hypothetical protein
MFCTECGNGATGRFCGRCGAATDPGSPAVGAKPVAVSVLLATPKPLSPGTPPTSPDTRLVVGRLRDMKRGPAIGLVVIAIIIVAVVGAALTSGGSGTTDDPMYQQGFREASTSSVVADAAGGPANVCSGLVQVSNNLDANWATNAGKEAYYAGCVAGYNNK